MNNQTTNLSKSQKRHIKMKKYKQALLDIKKYLEIDKNKLLNEDEYDYIIYADYFKYILDIVNKALGSDKE